MESEVSILGARGFDRGRPTELQAEVPLTSQNKWQKNNCQRSSTNCSLNKSRTSNLTSP